MQNENTYPDWMTVASFLNTSSQMVHLHTLGKHCSVLKHTLTPRFASDRIFCSDKIRFSNADIHLEYLSVHISTVLSFVTGVIINEQQAKNKLFFLQIRQFFWQNNHTCTYLWSLYNCRFISKELIQRLGIDDIILILQQNRLRWYGHMLWKEDTDWVKKCMEYR